MANPAEAPVNENPGARAGATGAIITGQESTHTEGYADGDAGASLPSRVRDWNRQRWAWKRSLLRDRRLSDGAKLLAVTLCDSYANHSTALCTPGLPALAEALGRSERAIQRALAELRRCGWIVTEEGRGRGRRMSVKFTEGDGEFPFLGQEKVADLCTRRAEKATRAAAENTTPATRKHDRSVTPYNNEGTKDKTNYPPTPQTRHERRRWSPATATIAGVTELLRAKHTVPPPDPIDPPAEAGSDAGETGQPATSPPPSRA